MSKTPVYVGIDVACAKRKRLPICFAAWNGKRLEPLGIPACLSERFPRGTGNKEIAKPDPFRESATELVTALHKTAETQGWEIAGVAIDAPAAPPRSGRRKSDRELNARGLSVFQTPSADQWKQIFDTCQAHLRDGGAIARLPHANKIWMQYGFRLFEELRKVQQPRLIEVYPHAIIRSFASKVAHKATREGYEGQLELIAKATGWRGDELNCRLRQTVPGMPHDKLDAFMAAWVASLEEPKRCAFGDKCDPDNSIWVPGAE